MSNQLRHKGKVAEEFGKNMKIMKTQANQHKRLYDTHGKLYD